MAVNNPTVAPYLTIKNGRKALALYQRIFAAKVLAEMAEEDGERLMHATIEINGGQIMLSDEFPEFSRFTAPSKDPISPVAVSLRFESAADVDRVHALALENDCIECWPPEDMFWGDRFSQIVDPFNHRWMLVAELSKD